MSDQLRAAVERLAGGVLPPLDLVDNGVCLPLIAVLLVGGVLHVRHDDEV